MNKPVVLCIGKSGQDIFLEGAVFKPLKEEGVFYEHIKLGEKFYVDNATFSTGGNAPNAAVTFARQHFEVSLISVVGDDPAGQSIIKALDAEHVNTGHVVVDPKLKTSFSTILLAPTGERTILDYPGTSVLQPAHIGDSLVECDWLYISSVGSMPLLAKVMKQAHKQGISIAFNPASFELKHIQESADLLKYVTLFAVNKEEASRFVAGKTTKELAKKLAESVKYVLVSDGAKGAVASDGIEVVSAGMYEDVPVKDRTGAGDAFTSGFVARIAEGKPLEEAIVFASANSTSVVNQIGAKAGILHGNPKLHTMPLHIESI